MKQQVEIRVKGCIDEQWSEWFDGLIIAHSGQDETVLSGPIPDPPALYGLIAKLRDLGVSLRSLECVEITVQTSCPNAAPSAPPFRGQGVVGHPD